VNTANRMSGKSMSAEAKSGTALPRSAHSPMARKATAAGTNEAMAYHLTLMRHRTTLPSSSRRPDRPPATPVTSTPMPFGSQLPTTSATSGGTSCGRTSRAKTRSHCMPKTSKKKAMRGERLIQSVNHEVTIAPRLKTHPTIAHCENVLLIPWVVILGGQQHRPAPWPKEWQKNGPGSPDLYDAQYSLARRQRQPREERVPALAQAQSLPAWEGINARQGVEEVDNAGWRAIITT